MQRICVLWLLVGLWAFGSGVSASGQELTPFQEALAAGRAAIAANDLEQARAQLVRALERDSRSQDAWALRADLAAASGDLDEQLYSLHVRYRLAVAQKADRKRLRELRSELEQLDERARDLLDLREVFVDKLEPVAKQYEKDKRWHSAIRVHQQILALDPDRDLSREAIERISAQPDPSLADTAKPKDLFEDVSAEWIREFDAKHSDWETRAEIERDNYITYTDAGYEVLLMAAEAMEQMNTFYREFFRYGTREDGGSVPRIRLHIFKNRDDYLKLGLGPPVEWSAGHFTGSHVETYVQGTFDQTVGVLFHEAAHQFVGLATNAVGWLNEGLASFFEGCRILSNGTVIMNLPANHRLFPLATRMEAGWMDAPWDGIDENNPSSSNPTKAPTFRIVLENKYLWGPPWYAPTWGVVYFLYNYQDPVDGRFVYRDSFHEFIDSSGGRAGRGAVENFEEVVLGNPSSPTKGVDGAGRKNLPRTVEELDELWKEWILQLRDEVSDRVKVERPYREWARYAQQRKEWTVAKEHFEKGVLEHPGDVELLVEFGELLAGRFKDSDRASKLALQALQVLESASEPDEAHIREVAALLGKWDPKRRQIERIHVQLEATARGLATRYLDAGLPTLAMEVSWRLGTELGLPTLFEIFEQGLRAGGRSLALWQLAYDEQSLEGWAAAGSEVWQPEGVELHSRFGDAKDDTYQFQFLTYDSPTSGDFSLEAELYAEGSICSFAGLVFGRKGDQDFHSLVYFPGHAGDERYGRRARQDYVDLTTFHGGGSYEIVRHNPLGNNPPSWHTLRVDVIGTLVDVWFDGQLVVTHEFGSTQSLRGSFGLMTGPGQARWRNVRYLSRSPRDIGAKIERELTMKELAADAEAKGEPLFGGSYLNQVPPFPIVERWVQDPISSWDELGPVPTVLLFFSIGQDRDLPVTPWLKWLVKEHENVGLRVIGIATWEDADALDAYAREVEFPGSLAIDERSGPGYGDTFERYAIHKFGMPRLLLLDVDQTVAWEGDPGFAFGDPWTPEFESYLATPLAQLISRRHLESIQDWIGRWRVARRALERGEMSQVWSVFEELDGLAGAERIPEVGDAKRKLEILDAALVGIEVTAQALTREEADGALATLLDWAQARGKSPDATTQKELRKVLGSRPSKDWASVLRAAEKALARMGDDAEKTLQAGHSLLADCEGRSGRLVAEFRAELEQACSAGSPRQVREVVQSAGGIPARWLIREYFGWSELTSLNPGE